MFRILKLEYFTFKIIALILALNFFSCNEEKKKEILVTPEINYSDSSKYKKLSAEYKEEKRKLIQDFYDKNLLPLDFNGGILIAQNGQVIFEKYSGFQYLKDSVLMTENSPLHLASVSKVLTSVAIMRLAMQNQLTLDQQVNTILPEFPYDTISIRMLLNHRSGVPNYFYFTSNDSLWNQDEFLQNSDVLQILSTQKLKLDFKPNTKFSYCNTNFVLLALIIEKLTKKPYPIAMQDLIFDPLKMKNSFVIDISKAKQFASYKSTYEEIPLNFIDATYGDKNIYSTPRDLLLFDLALHDERFLSKELKNEMFIPYSNEKPGVKNYGLGMRMKIFPGFDTIYYHTGWWHGNTAMFVHLEKENVTMIATSNKFTKRVYDIIQLAGYFGNYPIVSEESEEVKKLQIAN